MPFELMFVLSISFGFSIVQVCLAFDNAHGTDEHLWWMVIGSVAMLLSAFNPGWTLPGNTEVNQFLAVMGVTAYLAYGLKLIVVARRKAEAAVLDTKQHDTV